MNYVISVERHNGKPIRVVCADGPCEVLFGPGPTVLAKSYLFHDHTVTKRVMAKMLAQAAAIFSTKPGPARPGLTRPRQLEFSGSFA